MLANILTQYYMYLAVGSGCLLFVIFVAAATIIYRRRHQNKESEVLFGGTVKTPSLYQSSNLSMFPFHIQRKLDKDSLTMKRSLDAVASTVISIDDEGGLINAAGHRASWDGTTASDPAMSNLEWRVWFKVYYDQQHENLEITIFRIKCLCVSVMPNPKTSSVFFICYLLPDKNVRLQTSMYPNTGNTNFNETITFKVPKTTIIDKTLRLSLYEMDNSRNRITLGHVMVKLSEIQIRNNAVHFLCRDSQTSFAMSSDGRGEVHLSLCYDADAEKLKVQIFAAKQLPEVPPETKYYLSTNVIIGSKTAKTKNTQIHLSLSGVFNCSYTFGIASKVLNNCCLRFTIMQIDESSSAHESSLSNRERPWGIFIVGPCVFTHGSGLSHWMQMVNNNSKVVEMWHKISEID